MSDFTRGDHVKVECFPDKFNAIVVDFNDDSLLLSPLDSENEPQERCIWIRKADCKFANRPEKNRYDRVYTWNQRPYSTKGPHEPQHDKE